MPERKERQERLFMYRCPECGCGRSSMFTVHRTLIDRTVRCSGSPERIEVRPASESESLRRALEGLMEALDRNNSRWVFMVTACRGTGYEETAQRGAEENGVALSRLRALSQTSPEPEEEE
jgi:transcription elongation factor Elf1